jgi:hypothetical protein
MARTTSTVWPGQGATYRLQNPRLDVIDEARSLGEQYAQRILERNGSRLK